MRLWHQSLIPYLPRQQLLGQHRELAALRGKGWGKKHATVDYVFTHRPELLVAYHWHIIMEMQERGYNPDPVWENPNWRGSSIGEEIGWCDEQEVSSIWQDVNEMKRIIYPEHNNEYLKECIDNLRGKGVDVSEMEKLL